MRYVTKTLKTTYWRPGTDYKKIVVEFANTHAKENDVIVLSEKAISTSLGRLIDENGITPSLLAKFLANFWMRKIWGNLLVVIARINRANIERMRNYPLKDGAAHKQTVLIYFGLFYALKNFSEGGIDVSNLPYKYACLPIKEPELIAKKISSFIVKKTGKRVIVIISDSDKTFSFRNLHFSSRPTSIKGIYNIGPLAYLLGRFFQMRPRSTPIAISCKRIDAEETLRISAISNKARKSGAGRTAWDAANRFGVKITDVSWDMLGSLVHRPVVIVRKLPKLSKA